MASSRRWLWLLALAPLAFGIARLRLDVEVLHLLPADLPVVEGLKLYQENFSNARELIVTVRGPDAESTEAAARSLAESLRRAADLTTEVTWQPPWLEHPGEAAELIAYLWLNESPATFAQLTDRLAPDRLGDALDQARDALTFSLSPQDIAVRSHDPFGLTALPDASLSALPGLASDQELFASPDGTFRLIFVQARDELANFRACTIWLEAMQRVVRDWRGQDSSRSALAIRFTGRPAFVAEIAGGMQRDMAGPSAGTLAIIALLFYLTHRRLKPLLWLLALLLLVLAATLAVGGLLFGTLNVVSLGFASILLGLAEDFGIVLYQESRSHPGASVAEVRRLAAPGIFWSAVTVSSAFALLNLSRFPGLAQLGSLVALGICIAALLLVCFYLPPLSGRGAGTDAPGEHEQPRPSATVAPTLGHSILVWGASASIVVGGAVTLWLAPPRLDHSPSALRPKNGAAQAALDEIGVELSQPAEPQWVLVHGHDEREVVERLQGLDPLLARAGARGWIAGATLPTRLWPRAEHQDANRSAASRLALRWPRLHDAAIAHGFTPDSLSLTEQVLGTWSRAAASPGPFWPDNPSSRWVLDQATARGQGEFLALGLVHPATGSAGAARSGLLQLASELRGDGVLLTGWELLGASVSRMVVDELPRVLVPIALVVLVSLWLAFRSVAEVGLSVATVAVSGMLLTLSMSLLGWTWNMMSLMALPLLLGIGVDFSIHMQLALRRHQGDLKLVRDSIGRALLLAGSTTVAGFAALGFSSNAGMASLGKICAAGIVCAMVTAVYLAPLWWRACRPGAAGCGGSRTRSTAPRRGSARPRTAPR